MLRSTDCTAGDEMMHIEFRLTGFCVFIYVLAYALSTMLFVHINVAEMFPL